MDARKSVTILSQRFIPRAEHLRLFWIFIKWKMVFFAFSYRWIWLGVCSFNGLEISYFYSKIGLEKTFWTTLAQQNLKSQMPAMYKSVRQILRQTEYNLYTFYVITNLNLLLNPNSTSNYWAHTIHHHRYLLAYFSEEENATRAVMIVRPMTCPTVQRSQTRSLSFWAHWAEKECAAATAYPPTVQTISNEGSAPPPSSLVCGTHYFIRCPVFHHVARASSWSAWAWAGIGGGGGGGFEFSCGSHR